MVSYKLVGYVALSLAASATAQSNTTTNSYIPSTASLQCRTFLQQLDANAEFTKCLTAASTVVAGFASGASSSRSAVTSALQSFCAADKCSQGQYRDQLTQFSTACSEELSAKSDTVLRTYDLLYVLSPLSAAVCTTDAAGAYCLNSIVDTSAQSDSSGQLVFDVAGSLADSSSLYNSVGVDGKLPDTSNWRTHNFIFLLLNGKMPSTLLCTTCTKSIFAAFVGWESKFRYPLGLSNSPLLGSQSASWSDIGSVCGQGFLQAIQDEAGQVALSAGKTLSSFLSSSLSLLAGLVVVLLY